MDNLKPLNHKFYKFMLIKDTNRLEFIQEITAKPLELSGYEGIDLFIVKDIENNLTKWRVCESYTGFKIYSSSKAETKADAMRNSLELLTSKNCDKKTLIKKIKENIDKWSLSPRYQ